MTVTGVTVTKSENGVCDRRLMLWENKGKNDVKKYKLRFEKGRI